ncbi:UPF0696 protein C11orf68 -like protein [Ceratocystis fimbriata CBS 114723]|uniref:UPF0696 protein C11orf68-like protein n=1 Tax=Ceratocystis fimbriata CBS 114723 TaxID=1035309 RepID=A0A2C5XBG5_9PEZI|nr:UPF0696 protein C11orf68 -like protein [Ceratocystis fimbriata CBS 114723]
MEGDESDFYGDEDETRRLEGRVKGFDAAKWWQDPILPRGAFIKTQPTGDPSKGTVAKNSDFVNPFEGVSYAWQTHETIDAFLKRLPPSTTQVSPLVPWLYVCNPRSNFTTHKTSWQYQPSGGNEDEGPEMEGADLQRAQEGALVRLQAFHDTMKNVDSERKPQPFKTRLSNFERSEAVNNILQLSHSCQVRSGKWMLFAESESIDKFWKIIAQATIDDALGVAAKVQLSPESDPVQGRTERLICIYTRNFFDQEDVERVLAKLRELKVTPMKPIYYKPDIFTYLGIVPGNKYGIKASMYSSKDFLSTK